MELIKNKERLIANGEGESQCMARKLALDVLDECLIKADPRAALKRRVRLKGDVLLIDGDGYDLKRYNNLYVLGAGKGSGSLAEALEDVLGERITSGRVNVPKGTSKLFKTNVIRLLDASHPVPDETSLRATREILDLALQTGKGDLVITLISGGASALMTMPSPGLKLEDIQALSQDLMRRGADIRELNTVRKHLSQVKGGRLAEACHPAKVTGLIVSDVVGDPLDVIASGPTSPDPTTFEEAIQVITHYGLLGSYPDVEEHLRRGARGELKETLKTGDPLFGNVKNYILCSNNIVLDEVVAKFRGTADIRVLKRDVTGEARDVGKSLCTAFLKTEKAEKPLILLAGGETTVRVQGGGRGGRNQEMVLAVLELLAECEGKAFACIGSDGIDGMSEAAGAIADGKSIRHAEELGLDHREYLENNDSSTFFQKMGDQIITGPTGTNLNDIIVMVKV